MYVLARGRPRKRGSTARLSKGQAQEQRLRLEAQAQEERLRREAAKKKLEDAVKEL